MSSGSNYTLRFEVTLNVRSENRFDYGIDKADEIAIRVQDALDGFVYFDDLFPHNTEARWRAITKE